MGELLRDGVQFLSTISRSRAALSAEILFLRNLPRDCQVRVEDILGGLHHEYSLESCTA